MTESEEKTTTSKLDQSAVEAVEQQAVKIIEGIVEKIKSNSIKMIHSCNKEFLKSEKGKQYCDEIQKEITNGKALPILKFAANESAGFRVNEFANRGRLQFHPFHISVDSLTPKELNILRASISHANIQSKTEDLSTLKKEQREINQKTVGCEKRVNDLITEFEDLYKKVLADTAEK